MGLVHLDVARQPVPARPNHRSAELVQPRPRRLVAPQAQGSLQPQGAHPTLLVGDPPHRPKPRRQRGSGVLKNRPRRHRGLVGAARALPPPLPDAPRLGPVTPRAPKSLRPPELFQIRPTRLLGRESALEFGQISRIILHHLVRYIVGLPESSKYLVYVILLGPRCGSDQGESGAAHSSHHTGSEVNASGSTLSTVRRLCQRRYRTRRWNSSNCSRWSSCSLHCRIFLRLTFWRRAM